MYVHLDQAMHQDRKMQLFMRGMVSGNLQERDRLMHYTIGEFYAEMSLFIEECDKKEKDMEKMKSKNK